MNTKDCRNRRQLNPAFIKAWATVLIGGTVATLGISSLIFPRATPDPTTATDSTESIQSTDVPVVSTATLELNLAMAINQIELTVPRGSLYDRNWLNKFGESVEHAIRTYSALGESVPAKLHNMSAAWATIRHLCYDADTGVSGETILAMLAKTTTAEIGGLDNYHAYSTARAEQAAVIWCILNRVDYDYPDLFQGDHGDTAVAIVTECKAPYQFAYNINKEPYAGHEQLAFDVLCRWVLEHYGVLSDVGRTLPDNYKWFYAAGDGWHNVFRTTFEQGDDCQYWDWSLPDPYEAG